MRNKAPKRCTGESGPQRPQDLDASCVGQTESVASLGSKIHRLSRRLSGEIEGIRSRTERRATDLGDGCRLTRPDAASASACTSRALQMAPPGSFAAHGPQHQHYPIALPPRPTPGTGYSAEPAKACSLRLALYKYLPTDCTDHPVRSVMPTTPNALSAPLLELISQKKWTTTPTTRSPPRTTGRKMAKPN
jgi:hypothetical protein